MTALRLALSAVLWWIGALVVCAAAWVGPRHRVTRYEVQGVALVPEPPQTIRFADLEPERILVDPALWHDGLLAYAAFHSAEGRA